MNRRAVLLLLLLLGGCATPKPLPEPPGLRFDSVRLDYGGAGRNRATVILGEDFWEEMEALFAPPLDTAAEERERIRLAVARFEQVAGEQTPTGKDRGRNQAPRGGGTGAMDCVDESSNTTRYLLLLRSRGLLSHHDVLPPAWRGPPIIDPHYAARILEISTGRRFIVDSWWLDNGEPPILQSEPAWLRKEDPF